MAIWTIQTILNSIVFQNQFLLLAYTFPHTLNLVLLCFANPISFSITYIILNIVYDYPLFLSNSIEPTLLQVFI